MKSILNEIEAIYSTIQPKKQKEFIHKIIKCNGTIVGLGAGRMGYSLQAFVMRLSHFGYRSFMIGDTSIPMITEEDLIIVNSSSGNTKSIVLLTEIAKKNLLLKRQQLKIQKKLEKCLTFIGNSIRRTQTR